MLKIKKIRNKGMYTVRFRLIEDINNSPLPASKVLSKSFNNNWAYQNLRPYNVNNVINRDANKIIRSIDDIDLRNQVKQSIKDPINAEKLEKIWKGYAKKYMLENPFDYEDAYHKLCDVWLTNTRADDLWYAAKDIGLAWLSFTNNTGKDSNSINETHIKKISLEHLAKDQGYEIAYQIITNNPSIILNRYDYKKSDYGEVTNSSFSTYYYYDIEAEIGDEPFKWEHVGSQRYSGGWN